jgi:hypothetical protein
MKEDMRVTLEADRRLVKQVGNAVVGQFEIFLVAALVRAWSFHRLTAAATMFILGSFCENLKLTHYR